MIRQTSIDEIWRKKDKPVFATKEEYLRFEIRLHEQAEAHLRQISEDEARSAEILVDLIIV